MAILTEEEDKTVGEIEEILKVLKKGEHKFPHIKITEATNKLSRLPHWKAQKLQAELNRL